jgi:DNA-binding SARP family transcriptional activator
MSWDINVRLLGPLEVHVAGRRIRFDGAKQRKLFTVLVLHAPRAVPADILVEALWGNEPPAGGLQALQKQVSRLRRRLGDGSPVHHRPSGYALEIARDAIDIHRFETLLDRARVAACQHDPERAAAHLRTALTMWHGAALADHRFDEFAQRAILRLEELRMEAVEERVAAELATGRGADLVAELLTLVAEHPLRERLRAHLMVALYRAGRQAEALETMREGRRLLADELGIEPVPELRRLELMILAHDPALRIDHLPTQLTGPAARSSRGTATPGSPRRRRARRSSTRAAR